LACWCILVIEWCTFRGVEDPGEEKNAPAFFDFRGVEDPGEEKNAPAFFDFRGVRF